MQSNRVKFIERSWAVPAICGLLALHHDFKQGRFSNVTRLKWEKSSVDIYFEYGITDATGSSIESLDTVVTAYQSGAVGIRMSGTDTQENNRDILHFLVGEAFRESVRWNEDLKEWNEGALNDDLKSSTLALVCAVVATPFTEVAVVADKSISNARNIRKIVLLNETISTELTPSGEYGVNVYQAGLGAFENFRHRYVELDLRFGLAHEKSGYAKFIENTRNGALMVVLLPIATLAYLGDKLLLADRSADCDFVEHLPDAPLESRPDSGMSALSS